ncbi:MAG: glycosyltransferase [Candidatus Competibacteraceae bacterium]|nr:glycosyltransferase [Candidatus Competibacteraceae bacterium]
MSTESELIPYHAAPILGKGPSLALAPHPDDEVFGCAGAIMRHVAAGDPVTVIILTDGGGFHPDGPDRAAYVAQRRQESRTAATVLGYGEPIFWEYRDRELCYDEALVRRLCAAIAMTGACWLYAPSPYELHPDHRHLSLAALEAARRQGGGLTLAFYEVSAPLPPNRLLDISDLLERKSQAMRCFTSQLSAQAYDRHVEALNRYRTYTLPREVKAAEGYWVIAGDAVAESLRILRPMMAERWRMIDASAAVLGPRVSVIIRTMGRPELSEALHSIAMQTYPGIEIVVVDARGAGELTLEKAQSRFPLRMISAGHALGRSAAANQGLDAAQGEYLIFLDDDDWFEPDHIAGLVEILERESRTIAAYAGVRCVRRLTEDRWETVQVYNDPFDAARLRLENFIPINALLFRRAALSKARPCRFDEELDLYEDWDFWLQLLQHGGFQHRPALSANYRIHESGGLGVSADEQQALAAFETLVGKWRSQWSDRQLMDMMARARHLDRLLKTTEEQRALAVRKLDETGLAVQSLKAAHDKIQQQVEDRDRQLEQLHSRLEQLVADRNRQLEQSENRIQQLDQEWKSRCQELEIRLEARQLEIAQLDQDWQSRYAWVMNSRSWRLTAPLRDGVRWLRERRDRLTAILADSAWRLGLIVYRGPGGGLLRRLPFNWKQGARRWLRQGVITAPGGSAFARASSDENSLVSIIVPIYNHADYLEQCLSSALDQTYPEIEVIAVDDASTDPRVQEMLNQWANHPRLRLFANPVNRGIAETQNRALIESRGDIIGFLDCDDYLRPDAVETCLRYWREGIIYAHSARINVDESGREVSRISFEHLPRQDYFAENLERMYATHFKLIGREAFARIGLFDPRLDAAQDYDLLMRIAFHYPSSAFIHAPEFVYHHRFHDRQATETYSISQREATKIIQHEGRLRQAIREGRFDRFLSIIMLSFGKQRQTLAALASLQATVKPPHEIILFDNGSDSETVAFLHERIDGHFPTVRVIYHPTNLGPAAGRREALKQARGEWFLIFDNDEIAEPGWLEELLIRASSQPDVGAVCCKVAFPNRRLQFSGGFIRRFDEELIELGLYDRDLDVADLATAVFRECDWCPIGATLFTVNPGPFLHEGYPNAFEDAGVSMALRRQGLRLLNSPASWVWHEHFLFQEKMDMRERYVRSRYNPKRMLTSIASFYAETGMIIQDEYVWRENGLFALSRVELKQLLDRSRTVA